MICRGSCDGWHIINTVIYFLGLVSFSYYFSTMIVAVATGLVLVSVIRPGHTHHVLRAKTQDAIHIEAVDAFLDLLR